MSMTAEEFKKLEAEWQGIEYETNANDTLRDDQLQALTRRQLEVERLIDAAPWEYDDNEQLITKATPGEPGGD